MDYKNIYINSKENNIFKLKYNKYKNKYLELEKQKAGYIKFNISRGTPRTKDFITRLDQHMPLCSFYNEDQRNLILINNDNYILINKKEDEDYILIQLDNTFNSIVIEKEKDVIPINDDIFIPGINRVSYGIELFVAYHYHYLNIFRYFLSNVWTSGYPFFNRLKDIMYVKIGDEILYQKKINILLSFIFINQLDYILRILYNIDTILQETVLYHEYIQSRHPIDRDLEKIKTDILIDYIIAYNSKIDFLEKINSFNEFKDSFNINFSNIKILKFQDESTIYEFNIIMKILKIIYDYVEMNPDIIHQYNYCLYIHKYRDIQKAFKGKEIIEPKNTSYKSMMNFIDYDENIIKNKLVLDLTYIIYLCYKTNLEFNINENSRIEKIYNASQYILLDYFIGITNITNHCVPINTRQVFLKILNMNEEETVFKITDEEEEKKFYNIILNKFKPLKQFTFVNERQYTDCGETAIINMFNYLLLQSDGKFNITDIETWDEQLQILYTKYPTIDKMIDTTIFKLKSDIALVFNDRQPLINYNTYDIKTDMPNIINICCLLLNIPIIDELVIDNSEEKMLRAFINIFTKLKPDIDATKVEINENDIIYTDEFKLNLNSRHGEFILIKSFAQLQFQTPYHLDESKDEDNLHWIRLNTYATKYSIEHLNYFLNVWSNNYFQIKHFYKNVLSTNPDNEILIELVKKNPKQIKLFERSKLTEEICVIVILNSRVDSRYFNYIPFSVLNQNLCNIAIERIFTTIIYMPFKYINERLILSHIGLDGNEFIFEKINCFLTMENVQLLLKISIEYVRYICNLKPQFITPRNYIDFFDSKPNNIQYIPYEHQTERMVDNILRNNEKHEYIRYLNPDLLGTRSFNSYTLIHIRYIPQQYINLKIAEFYFRQLFENIKYIPFEYQTKRMANFILDKQHEYIRYLNPDLLTTRNFFSKTQKIHIRYIPQKYINVEIVNYFFSQSRDNIQYIPFQYQIQEMIEITKMDLKYVFYNNTIFTKINPNFLTHEDYIQSVREGYFLYIPFEIQTKEIIDVLRIYEENRFYKSRYFTKINSDFLTPDDYIRAVKEETINFFDIPFQNQTKEIIDILRRKLSYDFHKSSYFIKINPIFLTDEDWLKAFDNMPNIFDNMPIEYQTAEIFNIWFYKDNFVSRSFISKYKTFLTQEHCDILFAHNTENIEFIPHQFQNEEMVKILIENDFQKNIKSKSLREFINPELLH